MTGRDSKPSAASHVSCPVDDLSASLSGLSIQYGHAGDATSSGNARQDDEAGSQYRMRITLDSSNPHLFYPLQIRIGGDSVGGLPLRDQAVERGSNVSIHGGTGGTSILERERERDDSPADLGQAERGVRFGSGGGGELINNVSRMSYPLNITSIPLGARGSARLEELYQSSYFSGQISTSGFTLPWKNVGEAKYGNYYVIWAGFWVGIFGRGNWSFWECLIGPWRYNGARWGKVDSLESAKALYRSRIKDGAVRLLPIPTGPLPVSQRERRHFGDDEIHGYVVLVGVATGVCHTRIEAVQRMGETPGGWYEVYHTPEDAQIAWWLLECPIRAHQYIRLSSDFPQPILS